MLREFMRTWKLLSGLHWYSRDGKYGLYRLAGLRRQLAYPASYGGSRNALTLTSIFAILSAVTAASRR
jgi:hypothetical protein